jgi:hypothetical protein
MQMAEAFQGDGFRGPALGHERTPQRGSVMSASLSVGIDVCKVPLADLWGLASRFTVTKLAAGHCEDARRPSADGRGASRLGNLTVRLWHLADSLSGLASRPLTGAKQTPRNGSTRACTRKPSFPPNALICPFSRCLGFQ